MADPECGGRCAIRDTGRPGQPATIGPLPCSAILTQWRRGELGSLERLDHKLRRPSAAQEAGSEGIAVGRRQTPSIDGKTTS
jgi:hypothetical protein